MTRLAPPSDAQNADPGRRADRGGLCPAEWCTSAGLQIEASIVDSKFERAEHVEMDQPDPLLPVL